MGVYLGQSVYNDSQVTKQFVEEEIAKNGKGVFFATHGQTTFTSVLAEYNKGKVIICKYDPVTPGEQTEWYLALVRFNTETFDFVGVMQDGTIYRTGINVNEGWENVTTFIPEEIFIATYNVTSYSDILAAYNANKFILTKYAIPNTNYTIFAPLTFKGVTPFYFELIDRRITNQKIQMSIDDDGTWNYSVSSIVTVDIALDSSSHNPVENMAIAAELTAINNKITGDLNDIFLALASKGVTVPTGAGLDDVAGLIDDIPAGGGVEPIPDNWVRVSGIKSKKRIQAFSLDISSLGLTNEYLKSLMLVEVDTINAKPYDQPPYVVPMMSLFNTFFQEFYSYNNQNILRSKLINGGENYAIEEVMQGTTYGGFKNISVYRNVATVSGHTYTFNPRNYEIVNVNSIGLWGPFENDIYTYMTIFEATLLNNDKVVAHILPVMNTVNNRPGFFDEISGRLLRFELSDSEYQDFEIIP